jgi:hypothetical protein
MASGVKVSYRKFELKSDLAAVATLTGVAPSEARMIHTRPAVMQDLEIALDHVVQRGFDGSGRADGLQLLRHSIVPHRHRRR